MPKKTGKNHEGESTGQRFRYRSKKTGRFVSEGVFNRWGEEKIYKEEIEPLEPVEVRSGYDGRGQNSYTLIIHMLRPKGLDDQDLSNLVERMATEGKFDAAGKKWTNDLRWATFHNNFHVTKINHAPVKPKLVGFERKRP